ncbi:di-trans,poly-cis-decaprenylcistransferase [Patescibacteria group bacterium]|nr:di-trans,poly-cis-decaprenylcistransferase [Patescibacteria group bacterium]
MSETTKIDKTMVPEHIAIIMDGNRRWAREHKMHRRDGHREGAKSLESVMERAGDLGVKILTVYAFSSENRLKRTKKEIRELVALMKYFIIKKRKDLFQRGARLGILGNVKIFPDDLQQAIDKTVRLLKKNERIKLNIALNYGARPEIVDAMKRIMNTCKDPSEINEELISKNLYTHGEHDPDLIIRTGGEHRLSNFLLWQASYSELYFTNVLWPDFRQDDLDRAILEFQKRARRYGQ